MTVGDDITFGCICYTQDDWLRHVIFIKLNYQHRELIENIAL